MHQSWFKLTTGYPEPAVSKPLVNLTAKWYAPTKSRCWLANRLVI